MKNILLAMIFAFGTTSLRAEPLAYDPKPYLCQAMLVRLPTASAQTLSDSPDDPWPQAVAQIASGQATLLSAPSMMNMSGSKGSCQGTVAQLEVEFIVVNPGKCDVQMAFKSSALTFDNKPDYLHFELGRSQILSGVDDPADPTKRILLLFRVLSPPSSLKPISPNHT